MTLKCMDLESATDSFNKALIETASNLLGKKRLIKKPWITKDVLEICDKRRELKSKKGNPDGAKEYRKVNKMVKTSIKNAKENWIEQHVKT